MQLSTHLSFDGRCEAAFQFYQQCFGGRIGTMMTWGESPLAGDVPPEWASKILHASLEIGNDVLTGADVVPDLYEKPAGFAVLLSLDRLGECERIFQSLAEDGAVQVSLQETFWSPGFGLVVDQFGIPWEIHCEQAG